MMNTAVRFPGVCVHFVVAASSVILDVSKPTTMSSCTVKLYKYVDIDSCQEEMEKTSRDE